MFAIGFIVWGPFMLEVQNGVYCLGSLHAWGSKWGLSSGVPSCLRFKMGFIVWGPFMLEVQNGVYCLGYLHAWGSKWGLLSGVPSCLRFKMGFIVWGPFMLEVQNGVYCLTQLHLSVRMHENHANVTWRFCQLSLMMDPIFYSLLTKGIKC